MKIGLDISQTVYEGTGVGRFTGGLVNAILKHDRQNSWVFFFSSMRKSLDPRLSKAIKNSPHRLVQYRFPPTALAFLWNRMHRMKIEKLTGTLDWFITSDWTEGPSRMRKATIIHDLVYLRYPETVHPVIRENQADRMKWVKKESRLIFADSRSTKDDIEELLKIDGKHILVNYPGVDITEPEKNAVAQTRKRFRLEKPFILTVGKIEPRKNLKRLMEAFSGLKNPEADLVIVGPPGWDTESGAIAKGSGNIRFLNFVSDGELAALYSSCLFFAYPSLYEGFGYPVVEAMGAGAAVATSSVSSLKEIGEGSALLFDPLDTGSIARALQTLLHEEKLRRELSAKGRARARDFGWERYFQTMTLALMNSH